MALVLSMLMLVGQSAERGTPTIPDSLLGYFTFDDASPLSCLLTYFPPLFIQHGMELKDFLRSGSFRNIRTVVGDRKAIDAVFVRAMQLCDNNTAVALLLSSLATFDHRMVGLRVPALQLFLPLSNESTEDFEARVDNLPAQIYSDTPPGSRGDRDKLQHFFGSAFLTFIFESEETGERFGMFVEEGEDAFIVDGVLDDRDMRANRNGQKFGQALLDNQHRYPSEFFAIPQEGKTGDRPESNQGAE